MAKSKPIDPEAHLPTLTTDKLSALLSALAKGDLESAVKAGGGLTRSQLGELRPIGDVSPLLSALGKQAAYSLVLQTQLAILGALPGAVEAIQGLISAPASIREALDVMGPIAPPEPKSGVHPAIARDRQLDQKIEEAKGLVPNAHIMEQRRHAIDMLFELADKLRVMDLAEGFRDGDEESTLQRMAKDQGLDYLPPLGLLESPKTRVQ